MCETNFFPSHIPDFILIHFHSLLHETHSPLGIVWNIPHSTLGSCDQQEVASSEGQGKKESNVLIKIIFIFKNDDDDYDEEEDDDDEGQHFYSNSKPKVN